MRFAPPDSLALWRSRCTSTDAGSRNIEVNVSPRFAQHDVLVALAQRAAVRVHLEHGNVGLVVKRDASPAVLPLRLFAWKADSLALSIESA